MKSAKEFLTQKRTWGESNHSNKVNCLMLSLTKDMSDGEKLEALGQFAADLIRGVEGDITLFAIS